MQVIQFRAIIPTQEVIEGAAQDTAHNSHLWDEGTHSQLQQAGSYLREKVVF